jgi:hypothetical protein
LAGVDAFAEDHPTADVDRHGVEEEESVDEGEKPGGPDARADGDNDDDAGESVIELLGEEEGEMDDVNGGDEEGVAGAFDEGGVGVGAEPLEVFDRFSGVKEEKVVLGAVHDPETHDGGRPEVDGGEEKDEEGEKEGVARGAGSPEGV